MATKEEKESVKAVPKKALSRAEKAKKRMKTIYIAFAAVIALVLIFVGLGVGVGYSKDVKPGKKTVIKVYDEEFNAKYVSEVLSYISAQYPAYASYFVNQAVISVETAELLEHKAAELGYTVDEKEVSDIIKTYKFKDIDANRDMIRSSILQTQVEEKIIEPQLGDTAEHRDINLIGVDSKALADYVIEQLNNGAKWNDLTGNSMVSATASDTNIGLLPKALVDIKFGSNGLGDAIFAAQKGNVSLYEDADYSYSTVYEIVRLDSKKEDSAMISTLVFGSKSYAETAAKALKSGVKSFEDFQQYSLGDGKSFEVKITDTTSIYADFVFSTTQPDSYSDVINHNGYSGKGCYWVYVVNDSVDQAYSENDKSTIVANMLNEWMEDLYNSGKDAITEDFDDATTAWIIKQVTG